MKGILGRKLGMTQVFDPESGAVTPVTVAPVRCAVSTIESAERSSWVWSYPLRRMRIFCWAMCD